VKRRDLMKHLTQMAAAEGLVMESTEGGKHTKVIIGSRTSYVPRHNEINEITAQSIIKQMTRREDEGK
jgi:mRNA interferase HicA